MNIWRTRMMLKEQGGANGLACSVMKVVHQQVARSGDEQALVVSAVIWNGRQHWLHHLLLGC